MTDYLADAASKAANAHVALARTRYRPSVGPVGSEAVPVFEGTPRNQKEAPEESRGNLLLFRRASIQSEQMYM